MWFLHPLWQNLLTGNNYGELVMFAFVLFEFCLVIYTYKFTSIFKTIQLLQFLIGRDKNKQGLHSDKFAWFLFGFFF